MSISKGTARAIASKTLHNTEVPGYNYTPTTVTWTRPADWVSLTTVTSSEEKFVGLHAVHPDSNFLSLSAAGAYTVNWGDGVTENFASGVVASHIYNYATYDVTNTTLSSLGYKQVLVTVTPQAGQQLTALNLHQKHAQAGLLAYNSGFLDIVVSGQFLTDFRVAVVTPGTPTQAITFNALERVNIVRSDLQEPEYLFYWCQRLSKVVDLATSTKAVATIACTFTDVGDLVNATAHGLRNGNHIMLATLVTTTGIVANTFYYVVNATTNNFQISSTYGGAPIALTTDGSGSFVYGTNLQGLFLNSSALLDIPLIDTSKVISFKHMLSGCTSLQTLPQINTAQGRSFYTMLADSISLPSIPLIDTSAGVDFQSMFAGCFLLKTIPLLNTASGKIFNGMFSNCMMLESIPLINTSSGTDFGSMFAERSRLKTIPPINTQNGTSFQYMFMRSTISEVPLLNTASGTNFNGMFYQCTNLKTIPLFNTGAGLDFTNMVGNCTALTEFPPLNTAAGTNFSQMFGNCTALQTVPLLNLASALSTSLMFNNATSLTSVPLFNTAACTNFSYMFASCNGLQSVPLFNTAAGTNFYQMFGACYSLREVPLLNTAAGTNFSLMFYQCKVLKTIPLLNTAAGTNFSNMFNSCTALTTIPLINTAAGTDFSSMFYRCTALQSVPLLVTAAGTNFSSMFYQCVSLRTVPQFNTAAGSNFQQMFGGCQSLQSVPVFSFNVASSLLHNMFDECSSLSTIPALNLSNVIGFSSIFANCPQLSTINCTGIKNAISVGNCKLSKTAIQTFINNLGTGNGSSAVAVAPNWGADTQLQFGGTTTAGSAVATMTSTGHLSVGMNLVTKSTATGLNGTAVTFTDVGDLVTKTAHGIPNGTEVSFSAIVSTTGISIRTIYFVVGATANTFQVALTSGGAAIALTTNGTGTLVYPQFVTSISPNVSVTVSAPFLTTGVTGLTFRDVSVYRAVLKGWVLTAW